VTKAGEPPLPLAPSRWMAALFRSSRFEAGSRTCSSKNGEVVALTLAGDHLYAAISGGSVQIHSFADGKKIGERDLDAPLWDGMAVAGGRLFLSTRSDKLICLGDEEPRK